MSRLRCSVASPYNAEVHTWMPRSRSARFRNQRQSARRDSVHGEQRGVAGERPRVGYFPGLVHGLVLASRRPGTRVGRVVVTRAPYPRRRKRYGQRRTGDSGGLRGYLSCVGAESYLPEHIRGIAGLDRGRKRLPALRPLPTSHAEGLQWGLQPQAFKFSSWANSRATPRTKWAAPSGTGRPCLTTPSKRSAWTRTSLYVTNAVKHFKWERRGKARLHKNPSAREVAACRPWLVAEGSVSSTPHSSSASGRPRRGRSSGPVCGSFANVGRSSRCRTGSPSWSLRTPPRSCGSGEPAERHAAFAHSCMTYNRSSSTRPATVNA